MGMSYDYVRSGLASSKSVKTLEQRLERVEWLLGLRQTCGCSLREGETRCLEHQYTKFNDALFSDLRRLRAGNACPHGVSGVRCDDCYAAATALRKAK
jgi:hypothetical protein